jgi:hypothetical protein
MNKKMLFVIVLVMVLSMALSACGGQGGKVDQAVENATNGLLMSNTQAEQSVIDLVKDTCRKNADGTCKLMGQ